MSETERDRTGSQSAADQVEEAVLADTDAIDAPSDAVAEEGVFVADDAAEAPAPSGQAPAAPTQSGLSGTGSMIIGGLIAGAIGVAGTLTFLPEGWRPHDASPLERRIAALEGAGTGLTTADVAAAVSTALAPIDARLTPLEGITPPNLAPIEARIATLEAAGLDTQALTAALAPINNRIAQLEADIQAQARAAVDAALTEARADVQAQAATLAARETTVEAAQARIDTRAALAELVAAAESGVPAADALATLAAGSATPAALAPFADGLMTLSALQDAFAPAARDALNAEGPAPDAAMTDRLLTFLRAQTGARSLAPRDGNDTDAVLSRAEAALRQGDIAATLSELDALGDAPAAAMAAWRVQAQTRLDALVALDALQTQLTGNEG